MVQKSFHQMKGDVRMHNTKNHRKKFHSKMIQSCDLNDVDHLAMYFCTIRNCDFADLYSQLCWVILVMLGYFLDKRPLQKHSELRKRP